MTERTRPSILQVFDSEVALMISKSRKIPLIEGLRLFLSSETHTMLLDNQLRLWYFSPVVIFDLWENEVVTGDPRNSLYIRGDEIE